MTIRNLDVLLKPASVALIGASDRAQSLGATVMRNLLAAGFKGSIYPVNPARSEVAGQRAYRRVADLPTVPDLTDQNYRGPSWGMDAAGRNVFARYSVRF